MLREVFVRIFFILFAMVIGSGCRQKDSAERTASAPTLPKSEKAAAAPAPQYPVTRFPTAAEALKYLLKTANPTVIGFGEIHQSNDTIAVRSAIDRFTKEILPAATDRTADLIVETWVSTGQCGEAEQRITKDVDKVTNRPNETENETIRLLKAAVSQNIKPHVLEMSCDDYRRVYEADGGTDYLALLELVGGHLGKKALDARAARRKDKAAAKPMTIIYGGALHNDAVPSELWKDVTFGPSIVQSVGKEQYLEIDLIVPEFAEASKVLQQEPWMPAVRAAAAPSDVALIRWAERSYLLVFQSGVQTAPVPSGSKIQPPQK